MYLHAVRLGIKFFGEKINNLVISLSGDLGFKIVAIKTRYE